MVEFEAFEAGVEVNGRSVLAVVDGLGHFKDKAVAILAAHGISQLDAEEWYSQQSWLNAFREIAEKLGPHALYSIGAKIPENAQFPPSLDSLEKALASIDMAYHLNHRGGEIGTYELHKWSDGSLHFCCHNPYPCEFDRGIIEGVARKFGPADHYIIVKHDDSAPCRTKGEDSCTYHLEILKKGR